MRHFLCILFLGLLGMSSVGQNNKVAQIQGEVFGSIPDSLGLAGAFCGILGENQDLLLVAGGANFEEPVWENEKQFHSKVYLGHLGKENPIDPTKEGVSWIETELSLAHAVAYGSSVPFEDGLICIGGNNDHQVFDEVYFIRWNPAEEDLEIIPMPSLPLASTMGGAAIIGSYLYYTCGQYGLGLETANTKLWRLDLRGLPGPIPTRWEILPELPGPSRILQFTLAQHNGRNPVLYIGSGRRLKDSYTGSEPIEMLRDLWVFDPVAWEQGSEPWHSKAELPVCVMAAPAAAFGQAHLFVLGGADGSLIYKADSLRDLHPGFPKQAWAYHTITNTWTPLGLLPQNLVTTQVVRYQDRLLVVSGEMKPRTRSPLIYSYRLTDRQFSFGFLNYLTLILYLIAMLFVGVYFTRRNKNTNDFFRGGQRIPWWAAACSIFATMLSSLTYMSVPAKAFTTNWEYLLGYPAILITSVFVIYLILPFFRRIDATSAYEYLEKRFNKTARYLGSGFFILFQIGRMAIVLFLSALALSAITPLSAAECILIMGILSILYSTLGGVEAVVWTDTIQTFVLLGGAILIFVFVLIRLDGGFEQFLTVAQENHKFKSVNWDWGLGSYSTAAFWVILIGGFGQNLVSYGSDQSIIQRYMTTSSTQKAARSILTNGLLSLPAGLLFFAMGTALFVFYKSHPAQIDPGFQNDAIMPLFIIQEIPAGLAGLIIAGIFAAAQSTISTSMNSIATAAITDFARPLGTVKTEKKWLQLARLFTVLFGGLGTLLALIFASSDIKSLLDQFFAIIGLFGGALGGMFLLGMFTRKANAAGAVSGALIGALTLFLVSRFTDTHVYLYAAIGMGSTLISGWILSWIIPSQKKNISGLTVYDL